MVCSKRLSPLRRHGCHAACCDATPLPAPDTAGGKHETGGCHPSITTYDFQAARGSRGLACPRCSAPDQAAGRAREPSVEDKPEAGAVGRKQLGRQVLDSSLVPPPPLAPAWRSAAAVAHALPPRLPAPATAGAAAAGAAAAMEERVEGSHPSMAGCDKEVGVAQTAAAQAATQGASGGWARAQHSMAGRGRQHSVLGGSRARAAARQGQRRWRAAERKWRPPLRHPPLPSARHTRTPTPSLPLISAGTLPYTPSRPAHCSHRSPLPSAPHACAPTHSIALSFSSTLPFRGGVE